MSHPAPGTKLAIRTADPPAQLDLQRLVQQIQSLPPLVRREIYNACDNEIRRYPAVDYNGQPYPAKKDRYRSDRRETHRSHPVHALWWLSAAIARDAQQLGAETRPTFRMAVGASEAEPFPGQYFEQTCLGVSTVEWLRLGMGEMVSLVVKAVGHPPLRLEVCAAAPEVLALVRVLDMASYPGMVESTLVRQAMGVSRFSMAQQQIEEALAFELRRSIRARNGYGIGLEEVRIIWEMLWRVPCRIRDWQMIKQQGMKFGWAAGLKHRGDAV